jgi:hypothetical protein
MEFPLASNLSLADRMALWMSVGRVVDGLWVGAHVDDSEEHSALRRLEDALCLIRTHDPYRYGRLRRDLSRIWVRLLPNASARFNRAARACELDARFVLGQDVSEIACAIIHEATHARLEHCGIVYGEAVRDRIESACRRQELRFVKRLPDTGELQERLQTWLSTPPEQAFWTDASFERRGDDGFADALKYLGIPAGMIAVLVWFRRRTRWLRRSA